MSCLLIHMIDHLITNKRFPPFLWISFHFSILLHSINLKSASLLFPPVLFLHFLSNMPYIHITALFLISFHLYSILFYSILFSFYFYHNSFSYFPHNITAIFSCNLTLSYYLIISHLIVSSYGVCFIPNLLTTSNSIHIKIKKQNKIIKMNRKKNSKW